MTPELFSQYLRAARDNNLLALVLKFDNIEIHATIGPEVASDPVPVTPKFEPSDWARDTANLDLPFEDE